MLPACPASSASPFHPQPSRIDTSPAPESPGTTAVAGIILAAGASSRFGSDKRRALLADGTPMLGAVAGVFARAFARTAVVLPPGDAFGLELCARLGLDAVPNERCREGLGTSLAAAMQWSLAQPGLQAVVVGLADMPWVHEDTLAALRDALVRFPGEPAMPLWQGRPGNPRGIPRNCFASLAQASGAQAAAHRIDWDAARTVTVDDPGIVRDVDTPADLAADADRLPASQAGDAAAGHA